jgi:transposase
MAVAPWIVSDELWQLVEPLLPRKERRGAIGRPRRRPERLIADRGYDHDKYRR